MNWDNQSRKVYVSFISLDKLEASAGSDVNSQGLLSLNELDLDASSGGDITYSGNPKTKDINKTSGGDVHGR